MNEETTVETTEMQDDSAQADAVQDQSAESSSDDGMLTLSSLLTGEAEEETATEEVAEESQDAEPEQPAKEEKINGGIKGRLLAENKKGYEAGRQAAMAEMQQQMQALQAQVDRLSQYELREKAAAIAKEQNVSEAVAMFLAEHGFGADSQSEVPKDTKGMPNRDPATGRFVSNNQSKDTAPSSDERAQFLYEQAQNIKRMSGVDPVALLQEADAETRGRVARGEMDFFDLVRENKSEEAPKKRTPPNIKTNSSNGPLRVGNLTDKDIDRITEQARMGRVIDMRM